METTRLTALVTRGRHALSQALRDAVQRVRRPIRHRPVRAAEGPQGPVLVVGRNRPYLDVRWLVDDAEGHLAVDFAGGLLDPWDVACYDRYGRPLDLALRADATVRLSVSDVAPDPVALRDRLTAVCDAARDQHEDVAEKFPCDIGDLDLPTGDVPAMAAVMATRFDHIRERPHAVEGDAGGHGPGGNGDGHAGPEHAGSRLHNFWHAIT